MPSEYGTPSSVSAPRCIDLFCGAGGLTLGFCQAGGLPVAAVDHDRESIATYKAMFSMCQDVYCGNIQDWDPQRDLGPVEVVIGGPPCQGFSLARGLRFVDDPRNHLYREFIRIVAKYKPNWVVMENVPGITNIGEGVILTQIYEDFDVIGFTLEHRVINMAEYGVPQLRKRAIFVGSRDGSEFRWPEPICQEASRNGDNSVEQDSLFGARAPFVTIADALGDLPWPPGRWFSHRANSQMRGPRNRSVLRDLAFTLRVRGDEFAFCENPAKSAFVPGSLPGVVLAYGHPQHSFQTLMRENPPSWITDWVPWPTTDVRPKALRGTRRLAVREQARLQTFPDWFQFAGGTYAQGRQIGNAVPPLFARQLFGELLAESYEVESGQRQFGSADELGSDFARASV